MDTEPIITLENVGKKYKIGTKDPYVSLRDTIGQVFSRRDKDAKKGEFWALQEVSFAITAGESIGIIGNNGAGKSTLLKVLSQITPPTTGKITMRGRVASLLEVGTGFHPELTGRENIFLNGAILGMSRQEIKSKFDEIVEFSGISKFLDTPVKRYSSGMYVRLAFAVAAHLEPEILIVDEVLAVGDVEFQKKCLGKMDQVSKESGRTVLFVSHNMEAIKAICKKCVLMKNGKIEMFGATDTVISHYLREQNQNQTTSLLDRKDRSGEGNVTFTNIEVTNAAGSKKIKSGDRLRFRMRYTSKLSEKIKNVRVVVVILNDDLRSVLWLDSDVTAKSFSNPLATKGEVICETDPVNLVEGQYYVHINFHIMGISQDCVLMATAFDIQTDNAEYGFKANPDLTVADYLVGFRFEQK